MLSLVVGISALLPGGPPAMQRREMLQRAAVGVFGGALSLAPGAALAYDAIPQVSMDLDAAEKLRRDREARPFKQMSLRVIALLQPECPSARARWSIELR